MFSVDKKKESENTERALGSEGDGEGTKRRRKKKESENMPREFGSEGDVEKITGRARKTLQKDRFFARGFPFYRFGRQVFYDLNEVRQIIRAGRVDGGRA